MSSLSDLPENLPAPVDDGACGHLVGMRLPDLALATTDGGEINFSELAGRCVIYVYPMTGQPNKALPQGWDEIPGARGCTPQSCAFRDHYQELRVLNAAVFGLSAQTTEYQQEAATRLQLPFSLVSDSRRQFIEALSLPTFTADEMVLAKRVTIIAQNGVIKHVFYPVFPPDDNANQVIRYLNGQN